MRKRLNTQKNDLLDFNVESLENRLLLAGNVDASVAGGSLHVDGDGDDNNVVIIQVNDDFAVVGIDTDLNDPDESYEFYGIDFDVKILSGVKKDIRVNLHGGDDLIFVGGRVENYGEALIDTGYFLGNGSEFQHAIVPRDLYINTHGGRDIIAVAGAEIGRDLTIDSGFGLHDTVVVGGGGLVVGLLESLEEEGYGGLLDVFGYDSFESEDEFISEIIGTLLGDVYVDRNLKIIDGINPSSDSIYVGGAEIGGNANISTGTGADSVYVGVGALVEVYQPWYDDGCDYDECEFQSNDNGGIDFGYLKVSADVYVGKSLNITTGNDDDLVRVGGSISSFIELHGDHGDHESLVAEEGDYDGDYGYYETYTIDGGVSVGKDLSVDSGNNDDTVLVAVDAVGQGGYYGGGGYRLAGLSSFENGFNVSARSVKLFTGYDDDFLQIGGLDYDDGEIFWDNDWIPGGWSYAGALQAERDLIINTSAGTDEVVMGGYSPAVIGYQQVARSLSEDGGSFLIDVGRNLTITMGTHDDVLDILGSPFLQAYPEGGVGAVFSVGTLYVGKDMKVDTGIGVDDVRIGDNGFNDDKPRFDSSEFGFSSFAAIQIGRDLKLDSGDQDDYVSLNNAYIGRNATFATGWGRDTLEIGEYRYYYPTVSSFDQGGGDSVIIEGKLSIDTSLERDTVDVRFTYVGRDMKVVTGIRDDYVSLDNVSVDGKLDVITELGNDEVYFYDVWVGGQITLKTDGGEDYVQMYYTNADKLSLDVGIEDDDVRICYSMFSSGATLKGGDGYDSLVHDLGSPSIIDFEDVYDKNDD